MDHSKATEVYKEAYNGSPHISDSFRRAAALSTVILRYEFDEASLLHFVSKYSDSIYSCNEKELNIIVSLSSCIQDGRTPSMPPSEKYDGRCCDELSVLFGVIWSCRSADTLRLFDALCTYTIEKWRSRCGLINQIEHFRMDLREKYFKLEDESVTEAINKLTSSSNISAQKTLHSAEAVSTVERLTQRELDNIEPIIREVRKAIKRDFVVRFKLYTKKVIEIDISDHTEQHIIINLIADEFIRSGDAELIKSAYLLFKSNLSINSPDIFL